MADIPSSFTKVNDVEVASDAPVTEALNFKYGGNDNYLKDERDSHESRIVVLENANTSASGIDNTPTTPLTWTAVEDGVEKAFGLSVSVTTTGRGVMIWLKDVSRGDAFSGYENSNSSVWSTIPDGFTVRIKRDTTNIKDYFPTSIPNAVPTYPQPIIGVGDFYFDVPAAGTYTYSLHGVVSTAFATHTLTNRFALSVFAL